MTTLFDRLNSKPVGIINIVVIVVNEVFAGLNETFNSTNYMQTRIICILLLLVLLLCDWNDFGSDVVELQHVGPQYCNHFFTNVIGCHSIQ